MSSALLPESEPGFLCPFDSHRLPPSARAEAFSTELSKRDSRSGDGFVAAFWVSSSVETEHFRPKLPKNISRSLIYLRLIQDSREPGSQKLHRSQWMHAARSAF